MNRCAACTLGIVTRNPVTLRLLGLCPLLAVSGTCAHAFTLSVLFATVVLACGVLSAAFRHLVSWRFKPMYHGLLAAFTTSIVIALASIVDFGAVAALGIYPALIAGNCFVLSVIQERGERQAVAPALKGTARDVAIIATFLTVFGAVRELAAYGRVFAAPDSVPTGPLPLLAGAPGALLLLALVLAGANALGGSRNAEADDARPAAARRA